MNRRNVLISAASAAAFVSSAAAEGPATRPARGPFIETDDGVQLFHRDCGYGRSILFVAAWGLNSLAWQYQMAPLMSAGFRCIAFDRRSHGRSSDPGFGYDIDRLADDLGCVMNGLQLENVVLVGHSLGAAEIVRYVTRHGAARVGGLVLIAPTTPLLVKTSDNPDGVDPTFFEGLRKRATQDFPGTVASNLRPFFVAETSQAMSDWVLNMMAQTPLYALIACNRALSTEDFRSELPKIRLSTLILQGDADVSAPLPITGRKTAALMPKAELKVYEGAPHGLIYTHMSRVNADIEAFSKLP
jgi:non-heme chloroperoxidase